jgi:iron complex outermembrane recepter protein
MYLWRMKIFSKSIAFLFFLSISFSIFAQTTAVISGQVLNEATKKPIPFAIVKALNSNSKKIAPTKANIDGEFKLETVIEPDKLDISALGFNSKSISVKSNSIGSIYLTENTSQLSEVVVSAQRGTKSSAIDKKEYSPSQLLSSQNASAAELVNAIPSVNMGNDGGNVSFRGDENVAVMINGKMSSLTGQNLSQIPATSIEKIEVIAVPNSKYNSEGSAGIINIVLKKANANYSGGYALGSIGNNNKYNGQLGYNWSLGKLAIAASYNYTYNEFYNTGWSNREYLQNPLLNSYRHVSDGMKYKRNHAVRLGMDYELNKQNSVSFSANIAKDWGSSYSNDDDTFRTKTSDIYSQWRLVNLEKDINTLYDVNLSFLHWAPNMKDKWTVELSRSDNMNDKYASYDRAYKIYEGINSNVLNQYTVDNLQRRPIMAIQTDYLYNINTTHQLETGLRLSNRDFRFTNVYREFNAEVPKWTNDFRFKENIYSLYGLVSSTISEKINTKLGLRMEQANTESFNIDSSLYVYNYFKAFPSAMVRYQLSQKGFMSASYSMRINRPGPGMLNPLQDVADPISKRLGNPKLEPEVINSYELAYGNDLTKNISFSTSAYYKVSNNAITRFLKPNPDGTITVSIDNIGKSTFSGFELISNIKLHKNIGLNISSNLSYNTLKYELGTSVYETGYLNYQGRGILNLKLPFDLEAQVIAFYKSPMNTPQGKVVFMSNIDCSVRKKFFNQKGLLIFSVFDILNDTKFGLINSDVDFQNAFERKRETRYATLSFRYNFGKESVSKKPKIEKPEPREGGEGGM